MEIKSVIETTAILCPTQEEFDRIGSLINSEFGMYFNSECFTSYEEKTCLYIDGGYSRLSWAEQNSFAIVNSNEILS